MEDAVHIRRTDAEFKLKRLIREKGPKGIKRDEIVEQPSTPDIHESEPEIVKHSSSPGAELEETKIVTSSSPGSTGGNVKKPKLSHRVPSSSGTKSEELKIVDAPFCKGANNQYFTEDLKDKEL